jgi:hypothetical protein
VALFLAVKIFIQVVPKMKTVALVHVILVKPKTIAANANKI